MFERTKTFLLVAKTGSFSSAASQLYISPSAVQQQMNSLERELGFKLLDRSPRGVGLTVAGKRYREGVEGVIDAYEALLDSCKRDAAAQSSIAVGITRNLSQPILMSLCASFIERYPEMRLITTVMDSDSRTHMIRSRRADVCVTTNYEFQPADDLELVPLFSVKQLAVMRTTHPLASKESVSLEDLASSDIMIWGSPKNYARLAEGMGGLGEIRLHGPLFDAAEMMAFCVSGGIVVTGSSISRAFGGVFAEVPIDADLGIEYCLMLHKDHGEPVRLFVELAKEKLCYDGRG